MGDLVEGCGLFGLVCQKERRSGYRGRGSGVKARVPLDWGLEGAGRGCGMTMEALCEDSSGQLPPSSQRETRHPAPITVRGGALAPPEHQPC